MKHGWLAAPMVVVWLIIVVFVISVKPVAVLWMVGAVVVIAIVAVVLDALGVGRAVDEHERAMRDGGPR